MRQSRSRTIGWIGGGALALAAVMAVGGGVARADSPTIRHSGLRFEATQTSEVQLALGQGDSLVGNEFVDHWAFAPKGSAAGSLDTTCQLVSSNATSTAQCVATAALANGQITIQGLVTISQDGPGDFDLAITGGTGVYRTARGVVHVHPLSETTEQVDFEVMS